MATGSASSTLLRLNLGLVLLGQRDYDEAEPVFLELAGELVQVGQRRPLARPKLGQGLRDTADRRERSVYYLSDSRIMPLIKTKIKS